MKYIDYPELSKLARRLEIDGSECSVHARIEAYSCKNVKRDKKLFRSLETAYQDETSNSPPIPSWATLDEMTPFGPFDKHNSRKTLYLLIATLNNAFPDHEFSDVRPSQFNKEVSGASVLNALSSNLVSHSAAGPDYARTYSAYPPSAELFPSSVPSSSSPYDSMIPSPNAPAQIISGTHPQVYKPIDDVVGLADCEVFSYVPDMDADPRANDLSDDEDDVASVGDDDSSSDDGLTFEFDDELDEFDAVRHGHPPTRRIGIPPLTPRKSSTDSNDSRMSSSSYGQVRLKRRGPLLWSSYWFFLNRKQKRILFISLWSRSRRPDGGLYLNDEDEGQTWRNDGSPSTLGVKERFIGWENSTGLGARSLRAVAA